MGFTGWNRSKEVCAMPLNTLESNHKLGSAEVQSAPSPWINKLPLGADLGASLRLGLLGGALRYPYERYPQRRPQRRQHERESPNRRGQQHYLHHDEGGNHPAFLDHGGGGDLQHIEQDCRRYGGEASTSGKANQGDEVRSLHPPLDPFAEGHGRQKERQDPG